MGDADPSRPCCSLDATKSPNDKNSYRLVTLANGIQALLVASSDEAKQNAACAVCVQVGSFSDPAGCCEGLAHYCEHMIFLGSQSFPKESEFEEFLSENGGDSNAFTECEYTCYYFEVNRKALDKALTMFAELFHEPLFAPDSSSRELQAIESEFQKKRHSDAVRAETLFASFAKSGHPWKSFGWGNLQSLQVEPGLKGVNLQEELRTFFSCHYKPHRMRLCLFSVEALDSLQALVERRFSVIPTSPDMEQLDFAASGLPFALERLPRLVRVRPVRDAHELSLSWQQPSQLANHLSKPQQYLSHLIGDEGHGSILCLLKDQGLATELSAGSDSDNFCHSTNSMIFNVEVSLTDRGMQEWPAVAKVVFQYIKMLQQNVGSLPEWPFEEKRLVAEMTYRFQQEKDPCDLVQELSCRMLPLYKHKSEHLLTGPWTYERFRPDLILPLLENLTARQCFIMISSTSYGRASGIEPTGEVSGSSEACGTEESGDGGAEQDAAEEDIDPEETKAKRVRLEDDEVCSVIPPQVIQRLDPLFDATAELHRMCIEPRFGTEYWETELSAELLRDWEECETHPHLHVQEPNAFIPTDFSFPPQDHMDDDNGVMLPGLSWDSSYSGFPRPPEPLWPVPREVSGRNMAPGFVLWHLGCAERFQQPRSEVWMKLTAPHYSLDPQNVKKEVLLDWYTWCLRDSLNEIIYPASKARLNCSVVSASHGLSLKYGGFSQKLLSFVDRVLKDIRLKDYFSRASLRSQAQKEELLRSYKNAWLKPASHCAQVRRILLMPSFQRPSAQEKHLSAADVKELHNFIDSFISTLGCEILATGNTCIAELERWADAQGTIAKVLAPTVQPVVEHEVVRLEPGTSIILLEPALDATQPNSAIEVYWQLPGRDPWQWDEHRVRLKVLLDLLEDIMYEPLFDELRTKQQLGYSVGCSTRHSFGVLGFSVHVLSAVQRPPCLLQRIEGFIAQFSGYIRSLEADKFSSHIVSLASRWLEPIRTLGELQSTFWSEIVPGYPVFNRTQRETALLSTVTKEELCEMFDAYILPHASMRACLITSVVPPLPQEPGASTGNEGDVAAFEKEGEALRCVAAGSVATGNAKRVKDELQFHSFARMHATRP